METDQRGLLANEKEEEISSNKQKITQIEQPEIFIDKVKSTVPLQHTNHKAQSTSVATERSKEEAHGKMPFIEIPFHEKRPLYVQNMETYHLVGKKEAFLGTEESKGFNSNMHKFQGKKPLTCIESTTSKETSCLMSNVHGCTESSDECNKAKISLIGVRKQKNGRYGAVITDKIRHKQVWLGTFDTIEEASQAYFSKKSEFEKLSQQGDRDYKPEKNFDQTQQIESPIVTSLSVGNDQTLDTASVSRINSDETTTHIVKVHKNNWSGKEPDSSKETTCLMANVHGTESSGECNTRTSNPKAKISLLGVRRQKTGRYGAVITDKIRHKKLWLGTFDTVEEASQAYFSKKSELENAKLNQQHNEDNRAKKNCDQIQQPESPVVLATLSGADVETLDTASVGMRNERNDFHRTHIAGVHMSKTSEKEPQSSKETSCLLANVHGTESSNECNTTNVSNPKAKRSLPGIRRQKNGRYGAVIRDTTRRKQVWLGTFDTAEQALQAYFSKKSELDNEKLNKQGNKENCDQIQQPEVPVVVCLPAANDQTLNAASLGRRNKRIDSHKATTYIVGVQKNKTSGKEPKSSKKTARLMDNVHSTESRDESNNTTTSCDPKAKISLIGIRKQKSGRYGAVIRDRIKHKKIWLGTFDTVEEASQAYLSKKSELKKLGQGSNKENKPKKNCDQVQQSESLVEASLSLANHNILNTAQVSRRNKRIDPQRTTHFFGVHKRKYSGKYTSEIRNPISKKRVWLGTFGTAEEASRAYQSKKLEFQRLVDAKQQAGNEQTHSTQDEKLKKYVNVKSGHEGVNCEKSLGGSEIDVPISNSSNGGTEQRIDSHEIGTAEEAFRAYQSTRFDLQSSKEVELQREMPTDSSAREKHEGQENNEDLQMGEWVELPGNRAVKFSLKLGLPIIDNYGSLLGEFSTLDDLSFCKTEDGNETFI